MHDYRYAERRNAAYRHNTRLIRPDARIEKFRRGLLHATVLPALAPVSAGTAARMAATGVSTCLSTQCLKPRSPLEKSSQTTD
jgi:hypothetical protein